MYSVQVLHPHVLGMRQRLALKLGAPAVGEQLRPKQATKMNVAALGLQVAVTPH